MRRNVGSVVLGFGALVALGLFLIAVPVGLVRLAGNPLPATVPSWSAVVGVVESGVLPPGFVSGVLALVVWIWWSQVVVSFATEVWASWRGRTARALPLRGLGAQPMVVRLLAIVVVAAGAISSPAQTAAASTASFSGIAVSAPAGVSGAYGVAADLPTRPGYAAEPPAMTEGPLSVNHPAGTEPAPPVLGPPQFPSAPAGQDGAALVAAAPLLGVPEVPIRVSGASSGEPRVISGDETESLRPADAGGRGTVTGRWDPVVPTTPSAPPAMPVAPTSPVTPAAAGFESAAAGYGLVYAYPIDSPAPIDPPVAVQGAGESGWVVVKPGDSLWSLAEEHLGDTQRWQEIFELNAGELGGGGVLRDPNLIHPGWRLRLPQPEAAGLSPGSGC